MNVRKLYRGAFTLIELLVVIAIIAILAAILFPVFAQAKESAKKAACTSNTKQHVLAIMMYIDGNEDRFPASQASRYPVPADGWKTGATWVANQAYHQSLWPNSVAGYLKSKELLKCPSAQPVADTASDWEADRAANPTRWAKSSYYYNGLIISYLHSAVVSPAGTPVLHEYSGYMKGYTGAQPSLNCSGAGPCIYQPTSAACATTVNGATSRCDRNIQQLHMNGMLVCFADGHAKFEARGTVQTPANTDPRKDPYTQYGKYINATAGAHPGRGWSAWWDNFSNDPALSQYDSSNGANRVGCHPTYFKPDIDRGSG